MPFILIASFAQYLAMRHGRRWLGWITAWMALQLALLPGFNIARRLAGYARRQSFTCGRLR